ncbi:hypothetical protein J8J40_34715, partial [Mycobacterium tuberculosis]|nr:hypothetical protein [Mycobacterium tuberculosis]
ERLGLLYREARFQTVRSSASGPLPAYAMGLAFGFGWSPCIGPILGTILAVAATNNQNEDLDGLLEIPPGVVCSTAGR